MKFVSIEDNYKKILEQTSHNSVEIIAVSKYASVDEIKEAYRVGIRNFGESYAQDAKKKVDELFDFYKDIKWHFIGRLQKNKVKYVVGLFDIIHSVDSYELSFEIAKKASEKKIIQEILLQVNVLKDPSKAGFFSEHLLNSVKEIKNLKNINIRGLMTIAPKTNNIEIQKECFHGLKGLKDMLNKKFNMSLTELSMGMSDDYLVAISCGATIIRLGKGVFDFNKSYMEDKND